MGRDVALVEREQMLQTLDRARLQSRSGGRTVLVAGEAGVGKTALVDALAASSSERVLRGACEPLFTARPLGPFVDIAASLPPSLAESLAGSGRVNAALPGLLDELSAQPSVVIVEDVHWADKASLDLIALLGRRMSATTSLLVVTFRDDELAIDHPLRQVLGSLVGSTGVERIRVQPLSVEGVARMLGTSIGQAQPVYQRTGGNPFFVTEVMAEPGEGLPASVTDAVLGRVARLEPPARRLLESLSIVPGPVPPDAARLLGGQYLDHFDQLFASGMVVRNGTDVAFRHELARQAVVATIDPVRTIELHRTAMNSLIESDADPALIAHHAEGAGASEAVLRYARRAAEAAVRVGAHREAAAQYGRAVRAGSPPLEAEAELLELGGHQALLADRFDIALDWCERAVALRRDLGDRHRLSASLIGLARVQGCYGRPDDAVKSSTDALDAVIDDSDSPEYRRALAGKAVNRWRDGAMVEALDIAREAMDRARRSGDRTVLKITLNNVGCMELLFDEKNEVSWGRLVELIDLAGEDGDTEAVGNAYINLLEYASIFRRGDLVDKFAADALEYCTDEGLDLWSRYLEAHQARSLMDRGRWDEATAALPRNVEMSTSPLPRINAGVVLGSMRARRGDAGARSILAEVAELVVGTDIDYDVLVAAATLEAMWLGVPLAPNQSDLADIARDGERHMRKWDLGAMAWWAKCAGVELPTLERTHVPWWLMVDEDFDAAADAWHELQSPYEEGLALCFGSDPEAGFAILDRLGANAARAAVSRDLRASGRRGVPRGQRATTRSNPAGLTARELEVAELLAQGLRNADIATRLVVTPKTVDHHVSAVLSKLGVSNRSAVAAALERAIAS
jgi:DNA-binding CsgD family transcriptional regulator/tetratricopeptide (TPR) repeat protein